MSLSSRLIALQGFGLTPIALAVQGLAAVLIDPVAPPPASNRGGGAYKRRRTSRMLPNWLPVKPKEEDEALLLLGLL